MKRYAEQFFEAGISMRTAKYIAGGIRMKYYQWIPGETRYANLQAFIPEFCVAVFPTDKLSFGAIIRNPVRSRMNANVPQRLPQEILAGMAYLLSQKLQLTASVHHRTGRLLSFHAGGEYAPLGKLFIRAGLQTLPVAQSYGFGLRTKNITIDAGIQAGNLPGIISSATISFQL
jgi:hypothetical protein